MRKLHGTRHVLALLGVAFAALGASSGVAPSAEAIDPIGVGSEVPDATVRTVAGESRSLRDVLGDGIAALVFYRGGW